MTRRHAQLPVAALLVTLIAGCGATTDRALELTRTALAAAAAPPPSTAGSAGPPSCLASLHPPASLPAPGAMPTASFMATIARRGHLVAGVDQNTLLLAYLNPRDGQLEGFEIDILRQLAEAIFGDPSAIDFKAITTAQRAPAVQNGQVDVVADAFTITCARAKLVDFTSPYFDAHQGVLVPTRSRARSMGDLRGRRVCATMGSTSIENVARHPGLIPFPVAQRTDCLVELQEGAVDAIASDDAILRGFHVQDPYTRLVVDARSPAPYGMAISQAHPDFVRFVNAVIARLRADGTWQALYAKWFGRPVPAPPTARYAG